MLKNRSIIPSIFILSVFPPSASFATDLRTSILEKEGLVAFWDFRLKNSEGQFIAQSNIEQTKDIKNLYPISLKRKTAYPSGNSVKYHLDEKGYTSETFPEEEYPGIPKIAAGDEAIADGPLGYAPKFMASRRYGRVERNSFEDLPLNIRGNQSFTIVMWVKPINEQKGHHFYAGIWDEGDGSARNGNRQYAVFGGLQLKRHLMLHLSSTGAASFPDYNSYAQEKATDGAVFDVDKWHYFVTRYDHLTGQADVFLNGIQTPLKHNWPGIRETYDPGAKSAHYPDSPRMSEVPQNPLLFNQPIYSPRAARVKLGGFNRENDHFPNKYSVDAYEMYLDFNLETTRPTATFGMTSKDHEGRAISDKPYANEVLQPVTSSPELDITFEALSDTGVLIGKIVGEKISLKNTVIDLSSLNSKGAQEVKITVQNSETKNLIGTSISKKLTEGADFTIGAPMGDVFSGNNPGTESYIDGIAVYWRALDTKEIESLNPANQHDEL